MTQLDQAGCQAEHQPKLRQVRPAKRQDVVRDGNGALDANKDQLERQGDPDNGR